ncbi:MAG: hypothetical protein ABI640_18215 [Gammaproteobacteria bacterium]
MRIQRATFAGAMLVAAAAVFAVACSRVRAPSEDAAARPQSLVHGNLRQLMRGILFSNSNVVFFAQGADPATVPQDTDPSSSVNPLASLYGGWEAIEDSGIAMAEAANLLMIPGRTCSNGKPVPVQNADWQRFVQGLRDAGMAAYKAGQSKDMDKVLDAAGTLTTACSDCHDVYREKTPERGGEAARCTTQ